MSDAETKPLVTSGDRGPAPSLEKGEEVLVKARRDSISSSTASTISTLSGVSATSEHVRASLRVNTEAVSSMESKIPTPSKIPMRRNSNIGTTSSSSSSPSSVSSATGGLSTPTKRRSVVGGESGPTVAPNRLGMAARVAPRALEKKVQRSGSTSDQRAAADGSAKMSSLELRKAYSATLKNRMGPPRSSSAKSRSQKPDVRTLGDLQSRHHNLQDLVDMEDDRRSSFGSVSSCSSISSAATSASMLSSASRYEQRGMATPTRKTAGIAVSARASPARHKSARKLWPTTVVKEEFTLDDASLNALKEQHFMAEEGVRDVLNEVSSGARSGANVDDANLLSQALRQLSSHSEVLMQCLEAFERKTYEQEEYVDSSNAEIDRLMSLLSGENAMASENGHLHIPSSDDGLPEALLIRAPATGEASGVIEPISFAKELTVVTESPEDEEKQRVEMLNAMKSDSPLSVYVRDILQNATDKIENKWKARFAEQLAEHEQALAQERERSSESVIASSRQATETMQSKDDELKSLREENSTISRQKKQIELDMDFLRQELDFMKEQLEEQDDEKSSSAHSFWQKTTDLAKKNRALTEDLAQANQTVSRLNETIKIMKLKATDVKADNLDRVRKTRELEADKNLLQDNLAAMEAKFNDEKTRREQFQVNVEQLTVENTALYAQMVALQTTHEAKMEELRQLYEKRNGVLAGEMKLLQTQNRLMRSSEPTSETSRSSGTSRFSREEEGEMSDRLKEMTDDLLNARQELGEKAEIISELERRIAEGELTRRKLHNTIQELRGNIRVHVRLRPFLRSDGEEGLNGQAPPPSLRCDTFGSTITTNAERPHTFAFDKIYGQSDSQDTVFDVSHDCIDLGVGCCLTCLLVNRTCRSLSSRLWTASTCVSLHTARPAPARLTL